MMAVRVVPVWGAEGKALLRRKRFSAYPRSFSLGSADPTFFLNTDMWDL